MYDGIFHLDLGHGGNDPGAIGNSKTEKVENLRKGLKLKKRVEEHGIKVNCTRTTDKYLSLTERANYLNNLCNDSNQLLISFHHNSFSDAEGCETFRSIHNSKTSKVSKFCDMILKEMNKLGFKNRGNKTRESTKYPGKDYYTIINKTKMKAVIFEAYFLSSKSDVKLGDKVEDEIIESLVYCVCWYYGKTYKPVVTKHWADDSYNYLKANGVGVSSKLYDTPLYRANGFSMMADLMQKLKKEIDVLRKEINNLKKQE